MPGKTKKNKTIKPGDARASLQEELKRGPWNRKHGELHIIGISRCREKEAILTIKDRKAEHRCPPPT